MNRREIANPPRLLPGRAPVLPTSLSGDDSRGRRRLRCADVARNRAERYARRRRKAKLLLPLISAAMFVMLFLERWPEALPFRNRKMTWSGKDRLLLATGCDDQDVDSVGQVGIDENDGRPQYRPSPDFLAKNVAQVVAFLIRNRGRLDTEAVRAKWDFLDRISLPLAVYLREIEANGAWDELETDVKAAPLAVPHRPSIAMPKSLWHRKVLAALPDWSERGEDLIRSAAVDGLAPELASAETEDRPEKESPKP